MYADDTVLYYFSSSIRDIEHHHELARVADWFTDTVGGHSERTSGKMLDFFTPSPLSVIVRI